MRSRFDLNPNPQHPSKEEDWKKLSSLFSIRSALNRRPNARRAALSFERRVLKRVLCVARFIFRSSRCYSLIAETEREKELIDWFREDGDAAGRDG